MSWSSGSEPIWKSPVFRDAFADSMGIPGHTRSLDGMKTAFLPALTLLRQCLDASLGRSPKLPQKDIDAARMAARNINKAASIASLSVAGKKDNTICYELLNSLSTHLHSMIAGDTLLVPAGWVESFVDKKEKKEEPLYEGYCVMIVVERTKNETFNLYVCNTESGNPNNSGLKFHPVSVAPEGIRHKRGLFVEGIRLQRLLDSWFWFLLFRTLIWPISEDKGDKHLASGAYQLYEVLLPALNQRTLGEIVDRNYFESKEEDLGVDYKCDTLSGDSSLYWCCMEAICISMRRAGASRAATAHFAALIAWEMCVLLKYDLERLSRAQEKLTFSEVELISFAVKQLASEVSSTAKEYGLFTCNDLKDMQNFIKDVIGLITPYEKEYSEFNLQSLIPADLDKAVFEPFGLFERFQRTESVEGLAGLSDILPMVRPVQFTLVPEKVTSYTEVASALRHCDHICTLLAYQIDTIKNSYAMRVALIQHVFTRVIPVPLAVGHPQESKCLWRQPVRYETQVDLLRLISLLIRHFASACMSLRVSASFDASRILTMACMATISDVVIRQRASDHPSLLCLHINGDPPPTPRFFFRPYSFQMGPFAAQSQYMKFTTPELCVVRTKILDYFSAQDATIASDHIIFDFEQSNALGNLESLLQQICWEIGFPETNLGMYVSGEQRAILDNYPEFEYYRDAVFMFKYMMSPTSDALPEIRAWMPEDATMTWKYKSDSGFVVKAFNRTLKCLIPELVENLAQRKKNREKEETGFMSYLRKNYLTFKSSVSDSDPSILLGKQIDLEEDVLHIRDLPPFEKRISARDCELLITYLTAPYMRIPLVLQFFSTPEHVNALAVPQLRNVLDAVLFEPELFEVAERDPFQTDEKFNLADLQIPFVDRSMLCTPCGLLINELTKSPTITVRSISKLLDLALEQDIGRYTEGAGPVILYILRLVVRVEGFIRFILEHYAWNCKIKEEQWVSTNVVNLSGAKSIIRGLECSKKNAEILAKSRAELRRLLNGRVFRMLEEWISHSVKTGAVDHACVVAAHLAFIFFHIPPEELNNKIITSLISCNIFLTTRHNFKISSTLFSDGVRRKSAEKGSSELLGQNLGLPDTDIFEMFQKQRGPILSYLESHPEERSSIMENVVLKVTTMKPSSDVLDNVLLASGQTSKGSDLSVWDAKDASGPSQSTASEAIPPSPKVPGLEMKTRNWRSMDGKYCIGRFIPDMKLRTPEEQEQAEKVRDYNRAEITAIDTEINIQLGTMTLKTSLLEPIDPRILNIPDFVRVFGRNGTKQMQCADVNSSTNRKWVRLIGQRHDLMLWNPDKRTPPKFPYTQPLETISDSWVMSALKPLLSEINELKNVTLLVSDRFNSRSEICHLGGYVKDPIGIIPSPDGDEKKSETLLAMREVVVYKRGPVVDIFNVVEHGRRFYRALIRSSNPAFSFSSMPFISSVSSGSPGTITVCGLDLAKHDDLNPKSRDTLVITRNLGISEKETQTFLPQRFLRGLLPAALVDTHEFWQNADDSITGYPKETNSAIMLVLHIQFFPDSSEVTICRKPLKSDQSGLKLSEQPLYLLNILTPSEGSVLRSLGDFLAKTEDISHCLVWTRTKLTGPGQKCSIDVIEMPRLNLSFFTQTDRSGVIRLYSNDHIGMFISSSAVDSITRLKRGLQHCIILESDDGDLGFLLPGYPPIARSPEDNTLTFDRRDTSWLNNLQLRHYFYPVHISLSFLFTQTLASSLYLLLLRFLNSDFEEVFRLAEGCVSDISLTPEEKQIVERFSMPELMTSQHPDAHACRLKLTLTTSEGGQNLTYPWSIGEELTWYIRKHAAVSSYCRLSYEDEDTLLAFCPDSRIEIRNRRSLLSALLNGAVSAKLEQPERPKVESEFDSVVDQSCFDPLADGIFKKLKSVSYGCPDDTSGSMTIGLLVQWLGNGLRIKGGTDNLGFLFFYELMTETLGLKILPSDRSHDLGSFLIRFLRPKEFMNRDANMSILRVLSYNPSLAIEFAPKVTEKGKAKNAYVKTLFMGGDNMFSKLMKELQLWLEKNRSTLQWNIPYSLNPAFMTTSVFLEKDEYVKILTATIAPRITNYGCNRRLLLPLPVIMGLGCSKDEIEAFASCPLLPLKLDKYVSSMRNAKYASGKAPINVSAHPICKLQFAKNTLHRYEEDYTNFINMENSKTSLRMKYLSESEIKEYINNPSLPNLEASITMLNEIQELLKKLAQYDSKFMSNAIKYVVDAGNYLGTFGVKQEVYDKNDPDLRYKLAFALARYGRQESSLWFEFLVASVLSEDAEKQLQKLNPFLSSGNVKRVLDMTVVSLLHANRLGQVRRCLSYLDDVLKNLTSLKTQSKPSVEEIERKVKSIFTRVEVLAQNLCMSRHYMKVQGEGVAFDPRYLVFEFSQNVVLRKSQVEMVDMFVQKVQNTENGAVCQQMIMGSGKTTVLAPLLALILADGSNLVCEVVPRPLLEFSRSIMRERFSAIIRKPIYTFDFDRFQEVTPRAHIKIEKAIESFGVLVSHPTAVKALVLKFAELLNMLDTPKSIPPAEMQSIKRQMEICQKIITIFRKAYLIIDEVDLVLHPLKSELNFPIGIREPLDFGGNIRGLGSGLRWAVPSHLIDGILFATEQKMSSLTHLDQSREAEVILARIADTIVEGLEKGVLQKSPHLVLLNRSFYFKEMMPLLAHWMLVWLSAKPHANISDRQIFKYLLLTSDQRDRVSEGSTVELNLNIDVLDDDFTKLLNLSYDWLHSFLPFILAKIDRVTFGLLTPEDIERALRVDPNMPKSRKLSAVPFVGKDVPSQASEFSHPDVVIGLTVLAFRYEGLRRSDFKILMEKLQEDLWNESGPVQRRAASRLFEDWVFQAGGLVRGTKPLKPRFSFARLPVAKKTRTYFQLPELSRTQQETIDWDSSIEVWSLRLIDFEDPDQFALIYALLKKSPQAVLYYLNEIIFPDIMKHQTIKLSASGQELGSTFLFSRRIGFSGTPSELIPTELGKCHYEKGSDGQMLQYLTDPSIASFDVLPLDWTVTSVLDRIATADPPFHALIDTGALITGMTNLEVARYLLVKGLPMMEGVVFLDSEDRKMILVRDGFRVMSLTQSGIPDEKRFSFYDQIHTTGMDIRQPLVCEAVITLGKDMVFRDYAQGSWRMRRLGVGQRLKVLIIPEVKRLMISQNAAAGKMGSFLDGPVKSLYSRDQCCDILQDICSWLVINGMKSEKVQFAMLCEQNLTNIWRKKAFALLLREHANVGTSVAPDLVPKAIDTFRERLDYSVRNCVPKTSTLSDRLTHLLHRNSVFVDKEDAPKVSAIQSAAAASQVSSLEANSEMDIDPDASRAFSSEQQQEQEQEQEQEKVFCWYHSSLIFSRNNNRNKKKKSKSCLSLNLLISSKRSTTQRSRMMCVGTCQN